MALKIDSAKVGRTVLEYAVLTVGTLLYCIPWEWFVIPNNYSSGGVTGLLTLLQYATDGAITVGVSYMVINVFLLLLAFFVLGKSFGVRTIFCIALSAVFFQILPKFPQMFSAEGGLLYIPEGVLVPLLAGMMEGIGLGIVLRYGGSTGGSDIFAMIINKYWPMSPGRFYLISDTVIIAMVLLLPGKTFADMVYGYLMMVSSWFFIDFVVVGAKSSVQVFVFSDKKSEIADYIMTHMNRGVTFLKAVGGYSGKEKDVLLILIRSKELHNLSDAVKSIDPKAFMSVSPANNVYGEGFEEIKTGIKQKEIKKLKAEND